jgi:hypothetical protein
MEGGMDLALGRFGDRRLEKGGPTSWRGWWRMGHAVSGCGASAVTGPARSASRGSCATPSVTIEEMVATAFGRTEAACAGQDILAVQDTTVTRASGGGRGSYLHATIAVDAASGAVLGALDAQFLERTGWRLNSGTLSRREPGRILDARRTFIQGALP